MIQASAPTDYRWYRRGEIQSGQLEPGKKPSETPSSFIAEFKTGTIRYLVSVVFDPRTGLGDIRLDVISVVP